MQAFLDLLKKNRPDIARTRTPLVGSATAEIIFKPGKQVKRFTKEELIRRATLKSFYVFPWASTKVLGQPAIRFYYEGKKIATAVQSPKTRRYTIFYLHLPQSGSKLSIEEQSLLERFFTQVVPLKAPKQALKPARLKR